MDKTVAGIILAAGESSRMGRDKALLPIGRETFVQHLIALLQGRVSPLLVVLGHHAEEIEAWITPQAAKRRPAKCAEPEAVAGSNAGASSDRKVVQDTEPDTEAKTEPITVLRNPEYRLGQLSSLKVAIRHLSAQPVEAALVALVDHPAISASVVELLLERFAKSHAPVLIPTCHGRRGHPVLFSRSLFAELLEAPIEEGARPVVRRHAAEVEVVETEEEGILLDIDLPADYAALLAKLK